MNRRSCTDLLHSGDIFDPPIYGNVDYRNGKIFNYWIDSLSSSFPALQVIFVGGALIVVILIVIIIRY